MKKLIAGVVLGVGLTAMAHGAGDPQAGEQNAAVCAGCHGQNGAKPIMGSYPKLSGLGEKYPLAEEQPSLIEVQERLMFAQVLEAVRALEEGVLMDIREGDVGAILAWGFAPWSGGPLSWLDMIGTPYAAERTAELAAQYGPRFATPALLEDMAKKGQSFYTRFAPSADKAA